MERFRPIYHQTTSYTNAIVESVLYQPNKGQAHFWGDLLDGNYIVVHRSGFAHLSTDPFLPEDAHEATIAQLDLLLRDSASLPEYMLFYHVPDGIKETWRISRAGSIRFRRRRRYVLDERRFLAIDPRTYEPPAGHFLRPLQNCPWADLQQFGLHLESRFYDSVDDFLENSFGFVLYNADGDPASISYAMGVVGQTSECDLLTLPGHRGRGLGYSVIANYVRESIRRHVTVGWDCFVDNHSNKWIQEWGSTSYREYDFVSFTRNPS